MEYTLLRERCWTEEAVEELDGFLYGATPQQAAADAALLAELRGP